MVQSAHIGISKAISDSEINIFQVYGERRSGTNFIEKLIKKNNTLKPVSRFGWKHGIPTYPILPSCCLFIVVVRNPKDWLQSFYRAPFEVDPGISKLSFSDFIRAEWESIYTPLDSGWSRHGYDLNYRLGRGEILQLDRHPIEGRRYKNVLELRSVKLAGHLSILNRGVNALIVRYEDIVNTTSDLLFLLATEFGIRCKTTPTPVKNRVGPSSTRPNADTMFKPEDLDHITQNLDLKLEARCGYSI